MMDEIWVSSRRVVYDLCREHGHLRADDLRRRIGCSQSAAHGMLLRMYRDGLLWRQERGRYALTGAAIHLFGATGVFAEVLDG